MIPFRRPSIFRIVLSILPCAVLLVALVARSTPLPARLLITAIAGITVWNPAAGLLASVALALLGEFVLALDNVVGFRLTEVILLSFIAVWLLRPPPDREGPRLPRYAWAAVWLFGVLLASLCVGISQELLRYPDVLGANLLAIARHYFRYSDPMGIADAARVLEGVALVAATMELVRWRPSLANSLPVALALSAVAAVAATVFLAFGIAPHAVIARQGLIGSTRIVAHVGDLNAAGTHFAMILCLTLGMSMRDRGRKRVFWLAAAGACALGLWMCRSRSAEAAVGLVIPAAALWALTTAWPRRRRAWLIGGVLGTQLVVGTVLVVQIERDPQNHTSGFRQQFAMSSIRAIGTHPFFGIGIGRYRRDSPNFLAPQVAWAYGSENAHNNYLQIATEAGIIGFFLYAVWFAGALRQGFSGLARAPGDWRLLGATAGIVAVLGTCLTGHPLLVPEVAATVFAQLALVAALGGSALMNERSTSAERAHVRPATPKAFWVAAIALGTVVLAVLPAWTLQTPMVPIHLEEVDGLYYTNEVGADGLPFHWTREYASVFAPAAARLAALQLRSPLAGIRHEPTLVEITSGGVKLRSVLVDDNWSTVAVNLPPPEPPLQVSRINLQVDQTAPVSALVPDAKDDHRVVGIQVGELKALSVSWEFLPRAPR